MELTTAFTVVTILIIVTYFQRKEVSIQRNAIRDLEGIRRNLHAEIQERSEECAWLRTDLSRVQDEYQAADILVDDIREKYQSLKVQFGMMSRRAELLDDQVSRIFEIANEEHD